MPLFSLQRDNLTLPTCEQKSPSKGWPFPWRCFTRLKTLSLQCPTASPSLFCLLTLVPHCFFLSDSPKAPSIQTPQDSYFEALACIWKRAGKQSLGGHKQNLVNTKSQEKGAVTPQDTDPGLPVSVQESLAEAWVSSGLLQGWGY